ncbi:MAG TPA: hypothetical protein VFH17_00030 [Coriobacteriia bacterium]|nr:hypothetical protein [Coriobacteriia bacterium]
MRRQRRALLLAVVTATVFIAGWRTLSSDVAPPPSPSPATGPSVFAADRSSHDTPQAPATPVFATYRTLQLHLPVAVKDVTEIAFHQASGASALAMTSLLPDADPALADNKRGTGRAASGQDADAEGPSALGGQVIRMWRTNRTGPPDTAADVGARPGAPVIAPVSGTVVEVRPYLLYGEHEDIEIHIQPTGWPEIDLVMIHVTDPTVAPGDVVVGGVTRIASVRLLSDRVTHQLSEYTPDGGDHVHFQLNRVTEPGASEPVGGS